MAQFYTLEEAARVLGMGPDELKQKAQQHEVRAFMDGGSWRFRVADVDELARRRGLGSDPDLSMSDLDLDLAAATPEGAAADSASDFDLSEFALDADGDAEGAGHPPHSAPVLDAVVEADLLLDDAALPPGPEGNTSSTIIGLEPDTRPRAGSGSGSAIGGKGAARSDVRPAISSDSDVRPAFRAPALSDSDVTVAPAGQPGLADSDVRLAPETGSFSAHALPTDPSASHIFTTSGATRKVPRPAAGPQPGSSGEIRPAGGAKPPAGGSASGITPTPAPGPAGKDYDSGSDFELAALDDSDEFDTTPRPRQIARRQRRHRLRPGPVGDQSGAPQRLRDQPPGPRLLGAGPLRPGPGQQRRAGPRRRPRPLQRALGHRAAGPEAGLRRRHRLRGRGHPLRGRRPDRPARRGQRLRPRRGRPHRPHLRGPRPGRGQRRHQRRHGPGTGAAGRRG